MIDDAGAMHVMMENRDCPSSFPLLVTVGKRSSRGGSSGLACLATTLQARRTCMLRL